MTERTFHYADGDFSFFRERTEHPDPRSFVMHAHRDPEIYCFLRGRGNYHIEGTVYPLCPGDVLLMRTAEAHMLEISPELPYERAVFNLRSEFLSSFDPSGTLSALFFDRPLGVNNRFRLRAMADGSFFDFLDEFGQDESDALHRTALLSRMMLLLSDAARIDSPDGDAASGRAAQIVRYINDHLYEPLSLAEIASHFYLSRSQLCRVFRAATGSGVMEYVRIKRLMAAREQMRTGVPASQAAASCGFGDYSSFYRSYRARFGESPADRG